MFFPVPFILCADRREHRETPRNRRILWRIPSQTFSGFRQRASGRPPHEGVLKQKKSGHLKCPLFLSKPHEKDIFGILIVGFEPSNSQKVGSGSEPPGGRLQPGR